MGSFLSRLNTAVPGVISRSAQARVLLLGLNNAGKTTILYRVHPEGSKEGQVPTLGFNVETVRLTKGEKLNIWDVSGIEKARPGWRHYFESTCGLFFVVDSSDLSRMDEAKEELYKVLNHRDMKKVPLVVIANKQDLPGALKTSEVTEKLDLASLEDRKWFVQGASATNGEGLQESLRQLVKLMKASKR